MPQVYENKKFTFLASISFCISTVLKMKLVSVDLYRLVEKLIKNKQIQKSVRTKKKIRDHFGMVWNFDKISIRNKSEVTSNGKFNPIWLI